MKRLITAAIIALTLTGCDYKARKTFTITTTEGEQIRLTCPVVESSRSALTYIIDGHCVVEP